MYLCLNKKAIVLYLKFFCKIVTKAKQNNTASYIRRFLLLLFVLLFSRRQFLLQKCFAKKYSLILTFFLFHSDSKLKMIKKNINK